MVRYHVRYSRSEVLHLWHPLGLDILKRVRVAGGEEDQKDVRLRVREGSHSVVVLLTGCRKATHSA